MSKKRGLGKGLSALIGEEKVNREEIKDIEIDNIHPREDQPRRDFGEEGLRELSLSIKNHGVIQPILVRRQGGKYEIIAGERRYRASRLAGINKIPCIIIDGDEEKVSKLALIENIQREDLNPIEEALSYKSLIDEYNIRQDELANSLGKSRSYISNIIRLLKLEDGVIDEIYKGNLSMGHGKILLGIKDKEIQLEMCKKIIKDKLSVRETEDIIKKSKERSDKKDGKKNIKNKDIYILELEEKLMENLGTRVNLNMNKKRKKIEIEFYTDEDLERILDILTRQ